jgi:trehalose 6-phosphate synthase
MRGLCAYDLVGFQSEADHMHFCRYVQAEAHGQELGDGRWRLFNRTVHAGAFPIGVDVDGFQAMTEAPEAREMYSRMKREYSRRSLLVGVDRLDYSKGLPQRMRAFRKMLEAHPETHNNAVLIQIASPSREDVTAYSDILHELESLCGSINGNFGELDWMPVRYMHRTVARARLPGLYRASRVALVTPLRDGMNLVAKEFIVAQDPQDPGVLVLSRFAGAAEQLKEAVLVNPYDTDGMAAAIHVALQMPLEERMARHAALLENCRRYDVHWWCDSFMATLTNVHPDETGGTPWLQL